MFFCFSFLDGPFLRLFFSIVMPRQNIPVDSNNIFLFYSLFIFFSPLMFLLILNLVSQSTFLCNFSSVVKTARFFLMLLELLLLDFSFSVITLSLISICQQIPHNISYLPCESLFMTLPIFYLFILSPSIAVLLDPSTNFSIFRFNHLFLRSSFLCH